jgi:hypothetical protein
MNEDNLMMVMILGGFALCGAYFRAQYRDWRNRRTAEAEQKSRVRLMY